MEENKEAQWTVEDLQDMYSMTLQFPAENFAAPEFWQKLISDNAVSARFKSVAPGDIAKLWQLIMEKTQGSTKLFQSLLSDYVATIGKNKPLNEKIKKSLLDLFFSDAAKALPTDSSKVSTKRLTSEKPSEETKIAAGIVPSKEDLYEFQVATEERFPRIDLRSLLPYSISLTRRCDELDRCEIEKLASQEEQISEFIEKYKEASAKKLPEKWHSKMIKVPERKKLSEIKLDMMRRELKMLQQCYGKTVEEISKLYARSSGDFDRMRRYLKGEQVTLWEEAEDKALQKGKGSSEYKALVVEKGEDEVNKRKKFLESANNS